MEGSCQYQTSRGMIINEKYTGKSKRVDLHKQIKVCRAICKIIIQENDEKKLSSGTGFFLEIINKIYLVTNYHVLKEIKPNQILKIQIGIGTNKKVIELALDSKEIKKYEAPIDALLIPIKDNAKKYFNCFKFVYNYLNGYQQYLENETFLGGYALEEDITFTRGEIKKIFNNYEFEHNMDTDHGSSGSPVIL